METGKTHLKTSPIVEAIGEAEKFTTGEIRVHLSRRWFDPNPLGRAQKCFARFKMHQTKERNGVLLYVNLRLQKYAIFGDKGIHERVGDVYWSELSAALSRDLRATHYEKAIALAVITIGVTLTKFFPAQAGAENANELSNEVTQD